jgi:uncharacterized membrane protein YvlD (DUF360 family)
MWAIGAATFAALVFFLPGISLEGLTVPFLTIAAISFLNALVRPTLVRLSISPSYAVFSLAAMVVNGVLVWAAGRYLDAVTISGRWAPVLMASGMTSVAVIFEDLMAIDDDDTYYHHVVREIVKFFGKPEETDEPGILFLEIDGLSESIFLQALREGHMPTLARWLESGSHRLVRWECDLSSQTSASQAGILLGSNFDIPAFRWYEKDRRVQMVSNYPLDSREIERRLSSGQGLLADAGASRSNLFSGDAPQTMFTFSTLGDFSRHHAQDFYPFLMGPVNALRIAILFLLDVLQEYRAARFQHRHDVQPRVHRGGTYPLLRASTTILMRELSIHILIGDMYAGIPSVYATFFGYDEVAHHSGIDRPDAFDVLFRLDQQFDRLENTARFAPRPYHFVVLSDHGQSQGATFLQRYGTDLDDVVRKLATEEHSVEGIEADDAGWGNVSVFFTDLLNDIIPGDNRVISRAIRRALRPRMFGDQVAFGPYRKYLERRAEAREREQAEVIVMASGNLGLIYFTEWEERLSYEHINDAFPGMISGLAQHEGIGFVLVQSEEDGPMVIGANGMQTAFTTWRKVELLGKIHWQILVAMPRSICAGRTVSPMWPTSWSTACTTLRLAKWPPSRNWWVHMAAWAEIRRRRF